ncbi:MAG: hypothetical protein ACREI3_08495 [Nitrospirales bacterium]
MSAGIFSRCRRCEGLLVHSWINGFEGQLGMESLQVWRCVNCGDLLDEQVFLNRKVTPPLTLKSGSRARGPMVPRRSA